MGWLVKAAPVLAIGALLDALACRFTPRRWWQPILTSGGAVVLAVAILIYRPLVGAVTLSSHALRSGGGQASYVSTGLLPLRLQADGGTPVQLRAGEVGTVVAHRLDSSGRYAMSLSPHVPWWC